MSTTIDNRVVELQFNNKQFESNVKETMSTLERLKQSLNFKGASKGLENIQAAASKCDLSGLNRGIASVQTSFSALQVVGMTALATITNQAVVAGQRMVKALTIAPVTDGYREYETQMNAIQTILANTQKEGTNVAIVNKYLDELNEYADKTIYNFTEMTRNIGTFTAAGVKLDTSVSAIKGIANLAATSGSTSQQASTAMYQLSQAIASGTVKLMDWNSVVNAGMGGQVFQDALIRTSEHLQTGAKSAISANGSFRESLQTGWLTVDVLTQTLDQFATAADTQEEYEAAIKKFVAQGYTLEEAKQMADMAKTAGDAATKVKTFTQMVDTLKEALGSGWAQTWRLIVGDFDEARSLWTGVSDVLGGFINKFSDARNELLESALGKSFTGLAEKITGVLDPITEMAGGISEATSSLSDLGAIVDDVIIGKFGNGQERFDALTAAGENYYRVQNEVNKTLGDSYRYTDDQIAAQDKLLGIQTDSADAAKDETKQTKKLTDAQKSQIKQLAKLSNEQLEAQGYTKEQIAALQELRDTAEKLSMPFDEFIDKLDQINGRWILIEGIKNIGRAISSVFGAISEAFSNVFGSIQPDSLFDLITGFHGLTSSLIPSEETLGKITRAFQGLFSAIELVTTVVGAGFKLAFGVISTLLEGCGLTVLDFVAIVGDMVTKFNDWFQDSIFATAVEKIAESISGIITHVQEFVSSMQIDEGLANGFTAVAEGINAAWDIAKRGFSVSTKNILPIVKNVLGIFGTNMGEVLVKVSELIVKFRDWLKENTFLIGGIDKLSQMIAKAIEGVGDLVTKFFDLEKIQDLLDDITQAVKDFFSNFSDDIKLDGGILDVLTSALDTAFGNLDTWFTDLSNSEQFGTDFVNGIANGITAGAGAAVGAAISLATSIVDAICGVLGVDTLTETGEQMGAGLVTGVTSGVSGIWTMVSNFGSNLANTISNSSTKLYDAGYALFTGLWNGISTVWSSIKNFLSGVSQGISEIFGKIDWGVVLTVLGSAAIFITLGNIIKLVSRFADVAEKVVAPLDGLNNVLNAFAGNLKAQTLKAKADAIKSLAIAIGIIAASIWLISTIDIGAAWNAVAIVAVITVLLSVLAIALSRFALLTPTSISGLLSTVGSLVAIVSMFMSIGIGFIALAAAIKIISGIEWDGLLKAGAALGALGAVIAGLVFITRYAGSAEQILRLKTVMLTMSVVMLAIAAAIKIISSVSWGGLGRAIVGIAAFSFFMAGLMAVAALIDKKIGDVGATLLMAAAAIGVLAVVGKIISSMTWEDMGKAAIGITALSGIIVGLMAATRLVNKQVIGDVGATLLMAAVALGILALVAKQVASMSVGELARGAAGIALLELLILGLVKATKGASGMKGGKELLAAAATLMAMSACVGILAGVCVLLGLVDPATLARGVIAVALLAAIVSGMVYATKFASVDLKGTMVGIAVAIGVMAAAMVALSFIDPKKLVAPVLALGVLMGMFSVIVKAASFVKTTMGTIAILAGAIALLTGALALLAQFDAKSVLASAIGLSLVMSSLALCFLLIGKTGALATGALPALYAMVGVVALLGLVIGTMAYLKLEGTIEVAASLSILLLAMSASLLILAGVGAAAPAAAVGIFTLEAFIVSLIALFALLGDLGKTFPEVRDAMNTGLDMLKDLAVGIGEAIGGLVGGILEGATSTLPNVATSLSTFMTNLKPFIEGAAKIDSNTSNNISSLAGAILALVGVAAGSALVDTLVGYNTLGDFAEQLVPFGKALGKFSKSVQDIDTEAIENASKATQAIGEMAKSLPNSGGVAGFFAGENDIDVFGKKLVPFGRALANYSESVEDVDPELIRTSAKAATALGELASAIPNSGGVAGFFAGENDIDKFAEKLVPFGEALCSYSESVEDIDPGPIKASAKAATALGELASAIPNTGGLASLFAGDNDIDLFGNKLVPFGEALCNYSKSVEDIDPGPIKASAKAVTALAEFAAAIPNSGGLAALFAGENDIDLFGNRLVPFGQSLASYAEAVEGVDWKPVTSSAKAASGICDMLVSLNDIKGDPTEKLETFNSFSAALPTFGENIKAFADVFRGVDTDSFNQTVKIAESTKSMVESITSCIESLTADGMDKKFTNFTDASKYTTAIEELKELRSSLVRFANFSSDVDSSALESNADSIESIAKSAASIIEALTEEGALSKFTSFTDASKYTTAINELKKVRESLIEFGDLTGSTVEPASLKTNAEGIESVITSVTSVIDALTEDGMGEKFSSFNDAGKYTGAIEALKTVRDSLIQFADLTGSPVDVSTMGTTGESILASVKNAIDMIDALTENGVDRKFASFTDVSKYTAAVGKLKEVRDALVQFATFNSDIPVDPGSLSSNAGVIDTMFQNASSMIDTLTEDSEMFTKFNGSDVDYNSAIGKLQNVKNSLVAFATISNEAGAVADTTTMSTNVDGLRTMLTSVKNIITTLNENSEMFMTFSGSDTDFTGAITKLQGIRDALTAFGNIGGEEGGVDVTTMSSNVTNLQTMFGSIKGMINTLNNNADMFATFSTNNTDFAGAITKLQEVTGPLQTLAGSMTDVDSSSLSTFSTSIANVVAAIKSTKDTDTSKVSSFVAAVNELATANMSGVVETFKGAKDDIANIGSEIPGAFLEAFSAASGDMEGAGTQAVSSLKSGISSASDDLETAGSEAADKLISGVDGKGDDCNTAGSNAGQQVVSGASSASDGMSGAGGDLVAGLVAGITSPTSLQAAYDAGFKLGQKAVEGEKAGQASNSPSKLTIQAGKWLGEGLVIGIGKMTGDVYNAGHDLGETAVSSLSFAMDRATSLLDGMGGDAQPTIRPVVDLSNVESGAAAINGMFGNDFALNTKMNLNLDAINATMRRRNQNGVNDDVVSAINDLRKDIGNLENRSYSIGGITYSSGDEVVGAIETLVRAARIERRV